MINFLKDKIQMLSKKFAQYEQLRVNAENEYQAMSCGSFNPRFLAMIKKSNADKKRTTGVKPQRSKPKLPEALLLI